MVVAKRAKKSEKAPKVGEQIVAQNRAASYNYHILERHEAGLVLHGTEVKALREGKANIRDAYVDFNPQGAWLVNAHIAQYLPGGPWNHEPLGSRKLLLHKSEIDKLSGRAEAKGPASGELSRHCFLPIAFARFFSVSPRKLDRVRVQS